MKSYKITLRNEFKCENTYNELNYLIKTISKIFEKKNGHKNEAGYSAKSEFRQYLDLILSHLFEKTDFKAKLNNLKVSEFSINYFAIFPKLKGSDPTLLFEKLLELLSEELLKLGKIKSTNFKFIFLINIKKFDEFRISDIKKEELEVYLRILDIFKIKRIKELEDFSFENSIETEKAKILMKRFSSEGLEIIEIAKKGRDFRYSLEKALENLELLFGFYSFVRKHFMSTEKLGYSNHSIDELDYVASFVINDNEFVLNYSGELISLGLLNHDYLVSRIINFRKKELIDLKINYNKQKFIGFIDLFLDSNFKDKVKLIKPLDEFLVMYHRACYEPTLDYSFLKFWMLSERISKRINGNLRDHELKKFIKKILITFFEERYESFIKDRVDFLYRKRNALVHEGKLNLISEENRNLSKSIADRMLFFYIGHIELFNNLEDYKFFVQNIKKEESRLKKDNEILKLIIDDRNSDRSQNTKN